MTAFGSSANYLSYYNQINKPRFSFRLWDVGHGLSIWIKTPNGQNHWIDLGKSDNFSPSEHVNRMYDVESIDYLIISHPDQDHLLDLPNFLRSFGDPRVIRKNGTLPPNEKYGDMSLEYMRQFKRLDTNFKSNIDWACNPRNPKNNGGIEYLIECNTYSNNVTGNDTSLMVMVLYHGLLLVCPGDIEPSGWTLLWNKKGSEFEGLIQRSKTRVLVAPHHGRKSGYSQHMMDFVNPHLVIISDIWGDSETHPKFRENPLGIIQNGQNLKYFSTKRNGRVEIKESAYFGFEFHQHE
ncbi:MAG: ComEC/Rec2 family competence protein [Candidatus Hodarchaeales archaeon]